MAHKTISHQPQQFSHFPQEGYTYFSLYNDEGDFGVAALAEHEDSLEVHIELTRWGLQVLRALRKDNDWLRSYARSRGKSRVVGIKQETGELDERWPKFTRLMGFTGQAVVQTAFMETKNPA